MSIYVELVALVDGLNLLVGLSHCLEGLLGQCVAVLVRMELFRKLAVKRLNGSQGLALGEVAHATDEHFDIGLAELVRKEALFEGQLRGAAVL